MVRTLSDLGCKMTRIQHQFHFLTASINQGTIPSGIRTQCKFRSSVNDTLLQSLLNSLMMYSASRILDLLVTYYSNWFSNLRVGYYQKVNYFKQRCDSSSFSKGMSTVNHKLHRQKLETQKNHTSKLKRDLAEKDKVSYIKVNNYQPENAEEIGSLPKQSQRRKRNRRKLDKKAKRNRKSKFKTRRSIIKGKIPTKENVTQQQLDKVSINLTNAEITNNHKFVFYLGKSFAVTPGLPNMRRLKEDLDKWARSLRLSLFWARNKNIPKEPSTSNDTLNHMIDSRIKEMEKALIASSNKQVINSSGNYALELFISRVKHQITNYKNNRNFCLPKNIDSETHEALSEMKKWEDKVIRPFDKGTGFFILEKDDYIRRTEVHLNDTSTFDKIDDQAAAINNAIKAVTDWTIKYSTEPGMTTKLQNWLIPTHENTAGNNYLNLKAHKPHLDYPGRLISTGCSSYTKNLAIFTRHELRKVPLEHCVKDTRDFMRKLIDINNRGELVGKAIYHVSFDVVSMFPSISKDLGLSSCRTHLDKRDKNCQIFSTDSILEAIEVTLDHNLTMFNGTMYNQISGTAMGSSNACDYADVALSVLDEMVQEYRGVNKILLFARFRDDIYIPWVDSLDDLYLFKDWLNEFHPRIQFTMSEPSLDGIEFLDTFVYTKNANILTKPYCKPCDSHSYLVPTSCNPTHQVSNIPYSLAYRLFLISSEHCEFLKSRHDYTQYLLDRGYNINLINENFMKVESLDRLSIICDAKATNKDTCNDRCFPLVTDFNPGLPPIGKILHQNKHILSLDPELVKIIKPEKVFVSYRGNKTIQDSLVHSSLDNSNTKQVIYKSTPSNVGTIAQPISNIDHDIPVGLGGTVNVTDNVVSANSPDNGCFTCDAIRCKFCKFFLKTAKNAQSYHSDITVRISGHLNCGSSNVIYLINDTVCKRSSIGSTTDAVKDRWANHKSHIRKGIKSCEISNHYNSSFHVLTKEPMAAYDLCLSEQIEVIIIDQLQFDSETSVPDRSIKLKEKEAYWQHQLRTLEFWGGLNKRDSRVEQAGA